MSATEESLSWANKNEFNPLRDDERELDNIYIPAEYVPQLLPQLAQ